MLGRISGLIALTAFLLPGAGPDAKLAAFHVVAVDSNQQPVTDLTKEDFRITDEGRNQTIAYFRHVSDQRTGLPALGAGDYTNVTKAGGRHATVVLLDMLNQRVTTEAVTANLIVKQLGGIEDANELFLYAIGLDGKLFAIRGLDGTEAGGATASASRNNEPWTYRIKPLMDASMQKLQKVRPGDTNIINVRVDLTMKALQEFGALLTGYPGRKNLVWITDGIPIALAARSSQTGTAIDYTAQVRQTGDRFARSGVAFYPVAQFMMGSSDAMNGDLNSIETFKMLTELTGGRPDLGNDIGKAVEQSMRDLRSHYEIGYFPPDDNWNDRFHSLRITCTRKGVRLQAQTGYTALKEAEGAAADRATGDVMKTRTEATEIEMHAHVSADPKTPKQSNLAIRIAGEDIALTQDGDRFTGQARVTLILFRKDGNPVGIAAVPLKFSFDAAQKDKAVREGIEVNRSLNLEGMGMIRAIAFDFATSAVGSLAIPLEAAATPQ